MNYSAPAYSVAPVPVAAGMSTTKIIIIVVVSVVVAGVIFLGVVGLALGLGLGLGLRKSNPPPSITAPTVNCNSATATCGCPTTKPTYSSRIINGNIATANSWPWIVYLTMNGTKVCTGFLISQRYVLTASSCIANYQAGNITVNYGISTYQSSTVGANVTAANFTSLAGVLDNVAVVTLGVNLTYSAAVQPCCLTSDLTQPYINEVGVIAGWGETSSSSLGTVAPSLEQAVIQVRSPSVCNLQTSSNQFCASFDSISACPIDTGAPFMVAINNAWTCVGIATGAITSCTNPTTFTEVSAYAAFIKNITGITF